jgi:hypothetical protein
MITVHWSSHHLRADQHEAEVDPAAYAAWAPDRGLGTDIREARLMDIIEYIGDNNIPYTTGTGDLAFDEFANLELEDAPNIDPAYWTTKYPHAVDALAELVGKLEADVAEELALIAGDRATMPDAEVLDTFRGDNDLPETPEEFTEKQCALALFMFNMSNGPLDTLEQVVSHPSYGATYYDNYMADAADTLRSQPHLLGLGTREQMGIE